MQTLDPPSKQAIPITITGEFWIQCNAPTKHRNGCPMLTWHPLASQFPADLNQEKVSARASLENQLHASVSALPQYRLLIRLV